VPFLHSPLVFRSSDQNLAFVKRNFGGPLPSKLLSTSFGSRIVTSSEIKKTSVSYSKREKIGMVDRKARLAALAAKAGRTKVSDADTEDKDHVEGESNTNRKSQVVSFRNYAPHDETLSGIDGETEGGEEPDNKRQRTEESGKMGSSSVLKDALKEAKQEVVVATNIQGRRLTDGTSLPKKLNWDLMRDIQDKLNRLEKRTQKAIVEMLKERLEREAAEQASSDDSDLD